MLMTMTVTEALAEIKTIAKRIEKKREFVMQYIARQDGFKDPIREEGGSIAAIQSALQAIADLEQRIVKIRTAIQADNQTRRLFVEGEGRTVAEWLTWRKEVATGSRDFVAKMRATIENMRKKAQSQGVSVIGAAGQAQSPSDVVINVDESALVKEAERFEAVLGTLDGKLSLNNATSVITIF